MQEMTNPPIAQEQIEAVDPRAELVEQRDSGAGWFYWIAGLSLINLVILLLESDVYFPVGLGVTDLSYFVLETPIAMALSFGVLALFTLFGALARRGSAAIFVLGMLLYALDGVLCFVVFEDWIGVGFHLFVLWRLFSGLRAQMQLGQAEIA